MRNKITNYRYLKALFTALLLSVSNSIFADSSFIKIDDDENGFTITFNSTYAFNFNGDSQFDNKYSGNRRSKNIYHNNIDFSIKTFGNYEWDSGVGNYDFGFDKNCYLLSPLIK